MILGMRNYKEAIDMYSKIHKSSNYYQEAQYYLGECYLNQEEFIEAVEAYNKVNKDHYLFEKASSNISVIEKNFDLINSK
ncbi:tetratricopeptide repeat [Rickettsia japonica]|uniref:Tetratricopeptide repeat n=3 Tax=spotted fever group TaxID=114277 RepID=A0AAD1CBE6_RICJA|nr:Tetratricopeptide repeat-containing protein [Rickettsia conorii subsp. heilongjiangensis 054]AXU06768.1 hypothetical protein D0Z68_05480 [Rickettsia japonica]BAW83050.1 tetratricopeptide repeat [Rickettsia japonica]